MKNNTKLIIGVSLPLLVILFVISLIVFPKMFFNPKHDFVYTTDQTFTGSEYNFPRYSDARNWKPYEITDGKINEIKKPEITMTDPQNPAKTIFLELNYPKLYVYHVNKNSFEEISLEQAQKLNLTNGGSDPDGTIVTSGGQGNRGLFVDMMGGNSYYYGLYMKNGSFTKKITIQNGGQPDYYYNSNFSLIGWVK